MANKTIFLQLLSASLLAKATPAELQELSEMTAVDPELKYFTDVLEELWKQEPEADQTEISAAWEKIKERLK
jgi:hypothetical protein